MSVPLIQQCLAKQREENFRSSLYSFFGLKMQQHHAFLYFFNCFLNEMAFKHIVELGAGHGGLTYLLNLKSSIDKTEFYSFDCSHYRWHDRDLKATNAPLVIGDLFAVEQSSVIEHLLKAPGKSLLLCDAVKAKEFERFVPFLKSGDFVMVHDFAQDDTKAESNKTDKVWQWAECKLADLQIVGQANGIVRIPDFEPMVWFCGMKL